MPRKYPANPAPITAEDLAELSSAQLIATQTLLLQDIRGSSSISGRTKRNNFAAPMQSESRHLATAITTHSGCQTIRSRADKYLKAGDSQNLERLKSWVLFKSLVVA